MNESAASAVAVIVRLPVVHPDVGIVGADRQQLGPDRVDAETLQLCCSTDVSVEINQNILWLFTVRDLRTAQIELSVSHQSTM